MTIGLFNVNSKALHIIGP